MIKSYLPQYTLHPYFENRLDNYNFDWEFLSANSRAMDWLLANPDRIDWDFLALNEDNRALDLLESDIEEIAWERLKQNSNPRAIKLLLEYINKNINENFTFLLCIEIYGILYKNLLYSKGYQL